MPASVTLPVVAGLSIGIAFIVLFSLAFGQLPQQSRENDGMITLTGEVVCLPHKKFVGDDGMAVVTSECRIGFHARDDGKYYGLASLFYNDKIAWLFDAEGSEELFVVTGIAKPADAHEGGSRYDIAGFIEVTSAKRADGSVSIYEAYHRHREEIAPIVREIHERTGGGYSMGIDRECNNSGSEEGRPCIVITLEKDLPELSAGIPRQVEGYNVYVKLQDSG